MNIFITATDTDVGKTYVAKGIVAELLKRGMKTGYFKPLQSGIVQGIPSDADSVISGAKNYGSLTNDLHRNLVTKNSYVTNTPSTPSVSAEIDGVEIDMEKIKKDYDSLNDECDIVITEGSGGLFVPVNKTCLMSDVIKKLNIPVIIVARPDLGTINHTLLTLNALRGLKIEVLGAVISNYPENTDDPVITTAPGLIEKFGKTKVLSVINHNSTDFKALADKIL